MRHLRGAPDTFDIEDASQIKAVYIFLTFLGYAWLPEINVIPCLRSHHHESDRFAKSFLLGMVSEWPYFVGTDLEVRRSVLGAGSFWDKGHTHKTKKIGLFCFERGRP